MILIHCAPDHLVADADGKSLRLDLTLDALFTAENPLRFLQEQLSDAPPAEHPKRLGAPLQSQEVWAAGVTYFRSMTARKEESKDAGGGTFYDKVYDRSAALGPALLVTDGPLPSATEIGLEIRRRGATAFTGSSTISQIKRSFASLAEFLFRDNSFPHGCYLMTGTGIVPPDSFTLQRGDEVHITIAPVGTLINSIA